MSVAEALKNRVSTRAFLPDPVSHEEIVRIFSQAQQSPSNCNVQPWQIFIASGEARNRLQEQLVREVRAGKPIAPDFDWELKYEGVLRNRQVDCAVALYGALGIGRDDRDARNEAMLRNWMFFDAPHVAFFAMDRSNGMRGAVDLGIYAQSVALLMAEAGIGCCLQGALNQHPGPVREIFGIPESLGILFGMSFGYADPNAAANNARTGREPVANAVKFIE